MQVFTFRSDLKELNRIEQLVDIISDEFNIGETYFSNIATALTELFRNSVIHGNKFDSTRSVTIKYQMKNSIVSISISDEGKGFDYSSIDLSNFDNNENNSCIGLYIVKSVSDNLEFSDNGSTVTIEFDLSKSNELLSKARIDVLSNEKVKTKQLQNG